MLAYNVAEEGLNITAHRYFHGMASVSLNFMLQLPLEGMMSFLVGETLFHEGFIAGVNYGRNGEGDGTGLGDAQGAVFASLVLAPWAGSSPAPWRLN